MYATRTRTPRPRPRHPSRASWLWRIKVAFSLTTLVPNLRLRIHWCGGERTVQIHISSRSKKKRFYGTSRNGDEKNCQIVWHRSPPRWKRSLNHGFNLSKQLQLRQLEIMKSTRAPPNLWFKMESFLQSSFTNVFAVETPKS